MSFLAISLAALGLAGIYWRSRRRQAVPAWVHDFIVFLAANQAMTPAGTGHANRAISELIAGNPTISQKCQILTLFGLYVDHTGAKPSQTKASFAHLFGWIPSVLKYELAAYDAPISIMAILGTNEDHQSPRSAKEREALALTLHRSIRAGDPETLSMQDLLLKIALERSFKTRHGVDFQTFQTAMIDQGLAKAGLR
jgi:hypothetical protein